MKNDLGVDPDEWFRESIPMNESPPNSDEYHSPLPDSPSWEDTAPSEYEPDVVTQEDWFAEKKPEQPKTIHQKMYEIATARYNPFSLGGSENCDNDITCNLGGGSEQSHK